MTVDAGADAIEAKIALANTTAENVYVFCALDADNPADQDTSVGGHAEGLSQRLDTSQLETP
jgi:hypothetical protein